MTVYPLYLQPGASTEQVRQVIAGTLQQTPARTLPPLIISNAELRKEILDIFDRTFLLTYVLEAIAVIIAMLDRKSTRLNSSHT